MPRPKKKTGKANGTPPLPALPQDEKVDEEQVEAGEGLAPASADHLPAPAPAPAYTKTKGKTRRRGRKGPKTTFPWTEAQEEDLVDWWREHESLYNVHSAGYFNRARKERLFADKAEEIGDGCTAEDVQTHLRSLRTKLNHILKKGPGGGRVGPRTPRERWVWERLGFVRPFITHRKTKFSNKFAKCSSEEDSSLAGSDFRMGVEPLPVSDSNSSTWLQSKSQSQFKCQGKTKGGKHVPSKKAKMNIIDMGDQELELLTKLTTERENGTMTIIPKTRTRHQPVLPADEEEVEAFLEHLRCTLMRMPSQLRMELQADIIAMVYARHREHMQSCMHPDCQAVDQ